MPTSAIPATTPCGSGWSWRTRRLRRPLWRRGAGCGSTRGARVAPERLPGSPGPLGPRPSGIPRRRGYGVLRSSPRAAVSLHHRPVLVWRPEVGELGEEVVVWPHLVLCHLPVRQDGKQGIGHIVGEKTAVVRVGNRARGVVWEDIR